jgi:hypothetical protein
MACIRKVMKDLLCGPLCTGRETLAAMASGRGFESLGNAHLAEDQKRERESLATLAHGMQQEGYEGSPTWAIVHRETLSSLAAMASGRVFESLGNTHLVEDQKRERESHWLTLANTG